MDKGGDTSSCSGWDMERHIQETTARKVKMESEQRGAENTRQFLQRGQQDGDTKRGHYTP